MARPSRSKQSRAPYRGRAGGGSFSRTKPDPKTKRVSNRGYPEDRAAAARERLAASRPPYSERSERAPRGYAPRDERSARGPSNYRGKPEDAHVPRARGYIAPLFEPNTDPDMQRSGTRMRGPPRAPRAAPARAPIYQERAPRAYEPRERRESREPRVHEAAPAASAAPSARKEPRRAGRAPTSRDFYTGAAPQPTRDRTPPRSKTPSPHGDGTHYDAHGSEMPERIQKLLANAGVASRREAERMIEEERVYVNGLVATIGQSATRRDHITVNGITVSFPKPVYIALHKPKEVVTTVRDLYGQRTVLDLVPVEERIYPVGRLDKDTTGLLFLTNDGEFANRVMHPRYELEKTYLATLDRQFNSADRAKFAKGIYLKEGLVKANVRVISPRRIELRLHQGYNHVVKRICNELGYRVHDLVRTRIGPIKVDIPIGAFRELAPKEVAAILAAAKPTPTPSSGRRPRTGFYPQRTPARVAAGARTRR